METDISAEITLWVVNKIADILVDLAEDPDAGDPIDIDELTRQMKNVASLIVEAIDLQVVSSDGQRATVTIGES